MMTQADRVQSFQAGRRLRTVAVLSTQPYAGILDRVLAGGNYDVVLIESIDHAYSQIKRGMPDVVILCLDVDDAAGFQILSMLKLDDLTSSIPVITCFTAPDATASTDDTLELEGNPFSQPIVLSMN